MARGTVVVSVAGFRQKFTAFSDVVKYPDDVLQSTLDMATDYISTDNDFFMKDNTRILAIYLLTAHIQTLFDNLNAGEGQVGQVASSSVGSVSVQKVAPPNRNQLDWYLNSTTYGTMLYNLLKTATVMGVYIGGEREQVFR